MRGENEYEGGVSHLYILCLSTSGCLFVRLFVCLHPNNINTAEPIGPKFCVLSHMTPEKVYICSEFVQREDAHR